MTIEEEAEGVIARAMAGARNNPANLMRAVARLAGDQLAKLADHGEAAAHHSACSKRHIEKHVRALKSLGRRR